MLDSRFFILLYYRWVKQKIYERKEPLSFHSKQAQFILIILKILSHQSDSQ